MITANKHHRDTLYIPFAKRYEVQVAILANGIMNMTYSIIYMHFEVYLCFFLLSSAFRHEIILSALRCLESLVLCFSKRRQELTCLTVNSVHVTFKQIWTSTLRIIGVKRLTDCAFSLLTSLLKVQGVNFTLQLRLFFFTAKIGRIRGEE